MRSASKSQLKAKRPSALNKANRLSNPNDRKKLNAIASRMLAKSGFYDKTIYPESFGIDADMISGRSALRPNWHGRA